MSAIICQTVGMLDTFPSIVPIFASIGVSSDFDTLESSLVSMAINRLSSIPNRFSVSSRAAAIDVWMSSSLANSFFHALFKGGHPAFHVV
ncbi:hypothetical protein [uncultured Methylobacterium sp.]|uniref:hypothetical protein n=1 Tax=uncultured Methylobacterium sp. TaxID=157278 RepID=UPI0035CC39D7